MRRHMGAWNTNVLHMTYDAPTFVTRRNDESGQNLSPAGMVNPQIFTGLKNNVKFYV